jgi:methionyl-tRNA formyltransferase
VSLAPKLTVEDARVDWTAPASRVDRLVRGCTPAPGAWTTFRGDRLGLGPVRLRLDDTALAPGVLRLERSAVVVGTASCAVVLGEVRPAGKRAMPAADWARGVRPTADDRLGAAP